MRPHVGLKASRSPAEVFVKKAPWQHKRKGVYGHDSHGNYVEIRVECAGLGGTENHDTRQYVGHVTSVVFATRRLNSTHETSARTASAIKIATLTTKTRITEQWR